MKAYFNSNLGLIQQGEIYINSLKKKKPHPVEINITSHCGLNTHVE